MNDYTLLRNELYELSQLSDGWNGPATFGPNPAFVDIISKLIDWFQKNHYIAPKIMIGSDGFLALYVEFHGYDIEFGGESEDDNYLLVVRNDNEPLIGIDDISFDKLISIPVFIQLLDYQITYQRFDLLKNFKNGWNGEQSIAPSPDLFDSVYNLIEWLNYNHFKAPRIMIGDNGELSLKIKTGHYHFEISTMVYNKFSIIIIDHTNNKLIYSNDELSLATIFNLSILQDIKEVRYV